MADRYEPILDLIPRLRRFAYAVSGEAGIGDEVVKTAIADMLQPPFAAQENEKLFRRMLASVYGGLRARIGPVARPSIGANAVTDSSNVADRLMSLSLPERTALVLATTESLAYGSIAEIMGTGEPAVRGYLTQAREKLCVGSIDDPEPIADGENRVRAASP